MYKCKQATRIAPRQNTHATIAYKHTAPAMRNTSASLAYKHVSPQLSHRDAMGRLITNEKPNQPITATEIELRRKAMQAKLEPPRELEMAATQKKLRLAQKSVNGVLTHKDCNGVLTHSEVEGQLVARACAATLADPTAVYTPYTRGEGTMKRTTKTSVDAQVRNY